jgi:hypothetical protein
MNKHPELTHGLHFVISWHALITKDVVTTGRRNKKIQTNFIFMYKNDKKL